MTIVFILFAIKPTVETIATLQKQYSNQQEILTKLKQKTKDLSSARLNYQAIPDDKKIQLENAVPNKISLYTLVNSLESAAQSNQATISALQFQSLTIDTKEATQEAGEIQFTFNIEGTFSTLKKVLEAIKSSPRLILVDSLVFNKVEGGSSIIMSATGKAYYLKWPELSFY